MSAPDVSQIEAEMAATRDRLAKTIDQLVYRTNPKNMAKAQAETVKRQFLTETGEMNQDKLTKVAIGAAGVFVGLLIIRKLFR